MFEAAEVGRTVSKDHYKERVPRLREALVLAQVELRNAPFPLILLFSGFDGAGKGETINLLNEWMDPRWMTTRAYELRPTEEERLRPPYWKFWRDLPPNGRIALFHGGWYARPLLAEASDEGDVGFDRRLDEIRAFERTLADDGAVILKFWMHLSKEAQEERLHSLEADPENSWRVTERDWEHWRSHERFVATAQRMIAHTSTGEAPWHIIEGVDPKYRHLRVGELVLDTLRRELEELRERRALDFATASSPRAETGPSPLARPTSHPPPPPDEPQEEDSDGAQDEEAASSRPDISLDDLALPTIFGTLDQDRSLKKGDYRTKLATAQGRLNRLHRRARKLGVSTLVLFEGWDASGKGGAIRRLTAAFDMRSVQVIPVAAPTDEERSHHYLWRFWRHVPRAGRITVYDRSWYGRVLVERVEGLAPPKVWRRAYGEINEFERHLSEHATVVCKLWLHITKDEQLRRFRKRESTPYKRWKLTEEDWRNRARWDEYETAAHEMVERTSTPHAPWTLVPANDKRFARVFALTTVADALERRLDAVQKAAGDVATGTSNPPDKTEHHDESTR